MAYAGANPNGFGKQGHPLTQPTQPHENPRDWYRSIWGKRQTDDDALFEVMCLQVFQAGLSWSMVLGRRDAFRNAFVGWRIDEVAAMGPQDVERLRLDAAIIRNRQKIEACIANARSAKDLKAEHGSFCRWFYEVLPGYELEALQHVLREKFRFMGPEIARMWLLASGRVASEE